MAKDEEFSATLSEYIARIEKAEGRVKKFEKLRLITSKDLPIDLPENAGNREQIGWRLYEHQMFYVVRVSGDVKEHSHDEDVFRYIISGDLEVTIDSGKKYTPISTGMWFVIRANTPYAIRTSEYMALAGYKKLCKPTSADHCE